jgi:hypothetical protein
LRFDLTSMRFILITVLMAIFAASNVAKFRVTKVECNSSNKTLVNLRCWARAYDRRSPVVNMEYYAERIIDEGNVS